MLSDIYYILPWWFIVFIIGIIFLPITTSFFKKFFDRGYIFSKILGIIATAYALFVLGTVKILSFTQGSIIFILIIAFFINYFFLFKYKHKKIPHLNKIDFINSFKLNWKIYLIEEIIFLSVFVFWSFVKMFQPNINGLEKFMDFGIINSILRTDYFPAKDIWFTSFNINYYYFGHLITAMLTKLSGISSAVTFNLMQALVFAFCFSASFSIGSNLYFLAKEKLIKKVNHLRLLISGILTAFLVTFSGNLHVLYSFFKAYANETPVPIWLLNFLPFSFPNLYWYPNATRFIYNTIHEFPIYSWVVSDLHGHVLDIPFVLLTIAVFLNIVINEKINLFMIIFLSFLTSVLYMTNAWDGAIYLILAIIFIFYIYLLKKDTYKKLFTKTIFFSLILFIGYFIFSFPFNLFFKPFVSGIGFICPPDFLVNIKKIGPFLFEENHCQRSPIWQLLILYGFFYFWVLSFCIFLFKKIRQKSFKLLKTDKFIILLILFSTILIIIPEFIYIKDIYPAHYRANTMFKMVYQAFILLSISSSYIIIRIFSCFRKGLNNNLNKLLFIFYFAFSLILISTIFIYPYLSINSYYQEFKNVQGLDGVKYLKTSYPNDYDAIIWLNKNIKKQPVILEAQGDSYTDYARISSNTGLPTVLGWTVHEWLWRGRYDIPAPRINDIKTIYESLDLIKTKELINKYHISLVFIGSLEKEKYSDLNEVKFEKLGKIIYKNGNTKIYKIY